LRLVRLNLMKRTIGRYIKNEACSANLGPGLIQTGSVQLHRNENYDDWPFVMFKGNGNQKV